MVPLLGDVSDEGQVERVFDLHKPEIVFRRRCLSTCRLSSASRWRGARTNVLGTRHVADAAMRHHARANVLVSTDKAIRPST